MYRAFQAQLSSIMEALAKAAVAEVCGLVEESYAVLQLEISRSHSENEALRSKLRTAEDMLYRRDLQVGRSATLREASGGAGDFSAGEFLEHSTLSGEGGGCDLLTCGLTSPVC